MALKEKANAKLHEAYAYAVEHPNATCEHQSFIDFVIDNKHLTYKYVLFTALLAKATDASLNALCLQKQSSLLGAYDARTVCHKVIVPFEMEVLKKALGGSNEPFLNKPARFPELNKNNAVRRGNDQAILNSLCDNLPLITEQEDAEQCLIYLLCKLIKIRDKQSQLTNFTIDDSTNHPAKLLKYISEALTYSFEGETLTLMIAGVYHLMYKNNSDITVEVHPVNQSGASSREVSDLDIYYKDKLLSSNELKDKSYAETDVRHAADKVIRAGGTRMLFIEGPHGNSEGDFISTIEAEYLSKNFLLRVLSYRFFLPTAITSIETIDCEDFIRFILNTAKETKFKEEVIKYLDDLAQKIFGLTH